MKFPASFCLLAKWSTLGQKEADDKKNVWIYDSMCKIFKSQYGSKLNLFSVAPFDLRSDDSKWSYHKVQKDLNCHTIIYYAKKR